MNDTDAKTFPVHETFLSWQGEGVFMGRAAFFIRLHGCPLKCHWCDSADTWNPDFPPENIARVSIEKLAKMANDTAAEFVVITGGEPAIHDLTPLTSALHAANKRCHLETSGAFPIRGNFDWVTVSPKWQKPPTPENIALADELKIIVEDENSIARWVSFLDEISASRMAPLREKTVWLHPEWSQHENKKLLKQISDFVCKKGAPFRAGWQIHKCYGAE